MLAYRGLGVGLSKHVAWDFGFVLSLACVALTVVAVGYLGRNASARRWIGVLAAAFWTAWPLLVGLIAGHHAWTNGQWEVDAGLHNYSEPLSTLLVTAGAALVLAPRLTQMRLALAGCALGAATLVKLSNALLAAAALAVVFLRGRTRDALPYLAGALALAPLVAVYWPISYPKLFNNPQSWPRDPFDAGHIVSSWTHSSIFTPHTLAIVVPLAAIGIAGIVRPWALALVLAFLLINPVFYSFYANTAQHPRFLYASLPELFVLWAAGIAVLVRAAHAQPWRARSFAR
jgi:succinate dehydrogenase hydrophobic anchor subunit